MPPLEQLLNAVAQVREKYRDKILAARHPKRRKSLELCALLREDSELGKELQRRMTRQLRGTARFVG